jgi:eukaryotic-like serine/threonine-protein kinase
MTRSRAGDDASSFSAALEELARAPPVPLEVALPAGTIVDDKFELLSVLGRGGMGVVYLARDAALDREVALKMIRLDRVQARPGLVAAFEREARATARLSHPNVVTVHHFGCWQEQLYLVLERLRGETLAARLARGPLPLDELFTVAEQVLAGLAHAHAEGLVHRDLKPANVFLEESGRVKLVDFGLAAALDLTPFSAGTPTGTAHAGTPAYMAPEQWRGDAADARSDVWAMGVMLFELATGERPFASRPRGPLEDAFAFAPERAPAALRRVIAPALALEPRARQADASVLAADLRAARARATRRRRGRAVAKLAALLVLAAAAGTLVASRLRAQKLDPERIDLSGRWRYDPAGTGAAAFERLDAHHYRFRYTDGALDAAPSPDHFLFTGVVTVERDGDHLMMRGPMRDVPGSRWDGVGDMEFEVLGPDRVWMARSRWGPRPGVVTTAYEPWALVRVR